jgi:ribose-phosphate pyrophosphokinase
MGMVDEIRVFTGNSNPELAQNICKSLGVPLGAAKVRNFSDGEILVEIGENVRGRDVYVIQSTCERQQQPDGTADYDRCIKNAHQPTPSPQSCLLRLCTPGSQGAPRTPIFAKLVADLITTAGADRVVTIDLHAGQIQAFSTFGGQPLAAPVIHNYLKTL